MPKGVEHDKTTERIEHVLKGVSFVDAERR